MTPQEKATTEPKRIIFEHEREMPPMVVSLGTVLFNKTGTWRYLRPIYEEKMSPCNNACPAGTNIQGFIHLIRERKFVEAWRLIKETNPLPGVCGRVCPHPCELECNRRKYDEAISIHALERLAADSAFNEEASEELRLPRRKERIAIVGSGPAGLSCAYFLAKEGYQVTVFEALSAVGGMLRVGIPKYRLPREVLDKEIANIEALGVSFKTNSKIQDIRELKDYDAVVVAIGAQKSRRLNIPGEDVAGVISGMEFLKEVNLDGKTQIGKNVIIIGGGNTAIDAARSALRLGAKSTLIYRRSREEMPAIEEEVEAASKEGVEIIYLASPTKIIAQAGRVSEVEFVKMRLGEPDETGRKRPIPIEGSEFTRQADTVIAALGEEADLSLLPKGLELSESGVNFDGMQVFGGGDVVTLAGRVVDAIASGRRTANAIVRYFQGGEPESKPVKKLVSFENINTAYFPHQAAVKPSELPLAERTSGFAEINLGISIEDGVREAERCFSCGVCRQCDNCLNFCPEVAVSRRNSTYEINYDYCKGCGICATECPGNVISLVEEGR